MFGLVKESVPARFQRTFEGRPFDTCDYCRTSLRAQGVRYLVMKYHDDSELRSELAVCRACSTTLKQGYSAESKESLKQVYDQVYVEKRLNILVHADPEADLATLMTSQCSLCGVPRGQVSEWFEYALCEGEQLIYYTHPSMVCAACSFKVYNSLSAESKEQKRRFFEQHFGYYPPGGQSIDAQNRTRSLWLMG